MSTYPFMQVDAFTDHPLGGNPCAILFDTEDLDADTMLAVAREMNLSETSFGRQSDIADFGVRYFTPAEEIVLAVFLTQADPGAEPNKAREVEREHDPVERSHTCSPLCR